MLFTNVGFSIGDTTAIGIAARNFFATSKVNDLPATIENVSLYPNPVNDLFSIELNMKSKTNLAIEEDNLWQLIFYGGYPRPRFEKLDYSLWFESYIRTYLERDIRSLVNIHDLSVFQRFIKMCAARHGQMLNLTSLGTDCGISQSTARDWLSFMEAS